MTSRLKQLTIIFAIIMPLVVGCATPAATPPAPKGSLRPGFDVVYYPQIQPGMTLEGARRDWIALFPGSVFPGDRIEFEITQKKLTLFNYQLLNHKIAVEAARKANGDYEPGFDMQLPNYEIHFRDLDRAQRAADALFFFQQDLKAYAERLNQGLAQFEPVAARYRALAEKPPISENQRRLIVQANALSQQKKYAQAIAQYLKVVELDATSYPDAYYNLALLSGQLQRPVAAIVYMKHYLLLEPQAKDARAAQDKIYEWEYMIGQP